MKIHSLRQNIILTAVLLTATLFSTAFYSCHNPASGNASGDGLLITGAPDYSRTDMWYTCGTGTEGTVGQDRSADVFYITPTCIWDWKDSSGRTYHFMDVESPEQRAAVDGSNYLAFKMFEKSCNFYSPYYRQISMDSWFEDSETIEERYRLAHEDVVRAFRYYMEHLNQGRPFILAGHSQGAKAVIELLKHTLTDAEYDNMIAAYVFGFSVTEEESAEYPLLKASKGALDKGIICYNSVSSPSAASRLFEGNSICINPLNWCTDATYAPASENLGSVFFSADGKSDTLFRQVGARIDTQIQTLVIDGLDDDAYFIPVIAELFPKGNYHVQELNLYFLNIQANLEDRIREYTTNRKS